MQQIKIAEQVKSIIEQEMSKLSKNNNSNNHQDEYRAANDTPLSGNENEPIDYEHLLNALSDGFNQMIGSFHPTVGTSLTKIKEGYEELINSIVETLSTQIDYLSSEMNQLTTENQGLK